METECHAICFSLSGCHTSHLRADDCFRYMYVFSTDLLKIIQVK